MSFYQGAGEKLSPAVTMGVTIYLAKFGGGFFVPSFSAFLAFTLSFIVCKLTSWGFALSIEVVSMVGCRGSFREWVREGEEERSTGEKKKEKEEEMDQKGREE